MILRASIRRFSTRLFVDKLSKFIQASSQQEKQDISKQLTQIILQNKEVVSSNLVNDVVHRWATEQPEQEALWTYDLSNDRSEKVTLSDLYRQASRRANVLTGKEFHLQAGKTVCDQNYSLQRNVFLFARYLSYYQLLLQNIVSCN